jgi:predicted RNA-binding Zn ribbon-like protein
MTATLPGLLVPVNSCLVEPSRDLTGLDRLGGDLALDFVNTLGGLRDGPWDDEWLHGYADLVAWARHAGALGAAPPDPDRRRAAATFAAAIELREALYRVFAAQAAGAPPPETDLAALAAAHADAAAHARLSPGRRFAWSWPEDHPRAPLWPVAQSATDLLRSDRLSRLKQCRNCRWLFLDASRNGSRRWCSMEHCGIDAKVQARRSRRRARTTS